LLPAATVRPDDCSQLIRSCHTCSNLTIRRTPWGIGKPEDTGLQTTDPGKNGFVGRLRTIVPQEISPPHRRPKPRPAIIAPPPRAPRGFLRRRQERSEVAIESRVPRLCATPSRHQPTTPSGILCPPPRPTSRRIPPGTWVRRTLTKYALVSTHAERSSCPVGPRNGQLLDSQDRI
jgi:hypothetical protein